MKLPIDELRLMLHRWRHPLLVAAILLPHAVAAQTTGPGDPTSVYRDLDVHDVAALVPGFDGELFVLDVDGDLYRDDERIMRLGLQGLDMTIEPSGTLLVVFGVEGVDSLVRVDPVTLGRTGLAARTHGFLASRSMRLVEVDGSGDIWLLTLCLGNDRCALLQRLDPQALLKSTMTLTRSDFRDMALSPDGVVYLTAGPVLYRLEPSATLTPVFRLAGGTIDGIAFDARGAMYLGSTSGVHKLSRDLEPLHVPLATSGIASGRNLTFLSAADGSMTSRLVVPNGVVNCRLYGCRTIALLELNGAAIDAPGHRPGTNPVEVTTVSLRPALVDAAYGDTLRALSDGGAWRIVDGVLPPGVHMSGSGVVSGTPSMIGVFGITAEVTIEGRSSGRRLQLVVHDTVRIVLQDSQRRLGLGEPYVETFPTQGGVPEERAWSWSGSLPMGLSVGNGVIDGMPMEAGMFEFVLYVESGGARDSVIIEMEVVDALRFTAEVMRPPALLGNSYIDLLRTAGGVGSVTWSIAGELPPGLTFEPALGMVSGIPEEPGRFVFAATAVTAAGDSTTRTFVLDVNEPEVLESAIALHVLGKEILNERQRLYLDFIGNRNGRVDIGDMSVWRERKP